MQFSFKTEKLIIGRHGNSKWTSPRVGVDDNLDAFGCVQNTFDFDIIVYTDADTDACCNAAIEISADYFFFQESMRTLTIAHWVGLNP